VPTLSVTYILHVEEFMAYMQEIKALGNCFIQSSRNLWLTCRRLKL